MQDADTGTRRAGKRTFHRERTERAGERHGWRPLGVFVEHLVQPAPGHAAAEQLLPAGDHLLHRGQRSAGKDRAGDHHAGGDLALDRQQRAGAEDQRLQGDAHETPDAADVGRAVGRQGLPLEDAHVALEPAAADRRQHAHRLDHLGVAQVVVGVDAGLLRRLVGLGQRLARGDFGEHGQAHQDQRADQGDQRQDRVDQVGDQQVDRRPRRIEEGEQRIAGEELAHLRQILQGLRRISAGTAEVALEGGSEDALVQLHVEAVADTDQHARAGDLQQCHQHVQAAHQDGQHQQRGDVAADQGAVVDLHHVHRRRQHQQVDHATERAQRVEGMPQTEQHV
ncbi:hypothetical protein D3C78_729450 [compost metagenome]